MFHLITYCLLALFAVVITPREWVHHCDHEMGHAAHDTSGPAWEDNCSICDFEFAAFDSGSEPDTNVDVDPFQTIQSTLHGQVHAFAVRLADGRAPPVFA